MSQNGIPTTTVSNLSDLEMGRFSLLWAVSRQLPTYDGTKSYQNLLVEVYGGQASGGNNLTINSDSIIQFSPLGFIRGGNYYYASGRISNRNSFGDYWQFGGSDIENAQFSDFGASYLSAQASANKGYGFPIRCLVPLALPQKGIACYNSSRKGGRVVDGTGLENQQVKASQVRILSLPPNLQPERVVFCWQLPTYNGTKSYQNLLVGVYEMRTGYDKINSDLQIQSLPISFIRSGYYTYNSGTIISRNNYGIYWTSLVGGPINANRLYFDSTALVPSSNLDKGRGYTLRCLVR